MQANILINNFRIDYKIIKRRQIFIFNKMTEIAYLKNKEKAK